MRRLATLLSLLLAVSAAATPVVVPKNVQKTTDGTNSLTESVTVGNGTTLARTGTGAVSLNATLAALGGYLVGSADDGPLPGAGLPPQPKP